MAGMQTHLGRETTVEALGRTWQLSRLDRGTWRKFLDWAKDQLPDPVEVASRSLDKLPPAMQEVLVKQALAEATTHLSLGNPRVNALINSVEGCTHLVYLLLQQHQPGTDEDTAMAIVMDIGLQSLQDKLDEAGGVAGNGTAPAEAAAGRGRSTGGASTASSFRSAT